MQSKLPGVGTTIFSVMSALANAVGAVNLGQGFPNFEMDQRLCDLVHHYMRKGHNQYAPMAGVPELRMAIAKKIERLYKHLYDAENEITITAGGTQAIFTAISALVHEDDEVILFAPAYDCYAPAIDLCGGKPVWVSLNYPHYQIDWQHVKKLVNHRTKMIVINTPHNPSGSCLAESDFLELQKIVAGSAIVVLSDEVYEHIVFNGTRHQSISMFDVLRKQSLVVASFGKTFHCTGWKIGYIAGPMELMAEFRKVHQFNVFVCNTPVQYAIAQYMQDENTFLQLPEFYQAKRDYFLSRLETSRFTFTASKGTFFQTLSFAEISEEKDTDFAIRLTREYGIAGIPVSVFHPDHQDEKVLRFCFAKTNETLAKAAQILCDIK